MSSNNKNDAVHRNTDESLLEKRIRRRAKNKLKKEENKRIREEELRRKLCEPKDQRVRLVHQNELDKLFKKQQHVPSTSFRPNITVEEFPSLERSRSKTKDKRQKSLGCQNVSRQLVVSELDNSCPVVNGKITESPQHVTEVPEQTVACQNNQIQNSPPVKPKRNDPICIDVMTALKKFESTSSPDIRPSTMKKEVSPRLAGNQLDSSNPERKKGKMREIPKEKKPTILKRIILQERASRKNERENLARLGEVHVIADKSHLNETLSNQPVEQTSTEVPNKSEDIVHFQDTTETIDALLGLSIDSDAQITKLSHDSTNATNDTTIILNEDIEVAAQLKNTARLKMHSRRFREYCDHVLSPGLDTAVTALLADIVRFQDRAYFNDPVKAHAKRRFVVGFREVKKYLGLNKLKLIIIAPDLEKIKSAGGLDDIIAHIKADAIAREVPYVFAVGRKGLKIVTNKPHKIPGISCIGVLNWEGTQDNFTTIKSLLPLLREQYAYKVEEIDKQFEGDCKMEPVVAPVVDDSDRIEPVVDVNTEVVAAFLSKLTKELRNQ